MFIQIRNNKVVGVSPCPQPDIQEFREATAEDQSAIDDFYAKQEKLRQIALLEMSITPRRIREAIIGTDSGWLEQKESEISAIRQTL